VTARVCRRARGHCGWRVATGRSLALAAGCCLTVGRRLVAAGLLPAAVTSPAAAAPSQIPRPTRAAPRARAAGFLCPWAGRGDPRMMQGGGSTHHPGQPLPRRTRAAAWPCWTSASVLCRPSRRGTAPGGFAVPAAARVFPGRFAASVARGYRDGYPFLAFFPLAIFVLFLGAGS
jgi:hypothetical protein